MSKACTPLFLKLAIIIVASLFALVPLCHARDHYEILGVARNATAEEIKTAYRKLARVFHPDRQPGATEEEVTRSELRMKAINVAYETLGDVEKKLKYDMSHLDSGVSRSSARRSELLLLAQEILGRMGNASQLRPEELHALLTSFNAVMANVITSEDNGLYLLYSSVMTEIARYPKFATLPILKTLMVTTVVQGFTFGVNTQLNFWESSFDTYAVEWTAGHLFQHLANEADTNVTEVLNELIARSNTVEKIKTDFVDLQVRPKFNLGVTQYVYEFAVKRELIEDAASLIRFAETVATRIFDDTTRDSIINIFLESKIGYTLLFLKEATYDEVFYIISNLKQKSQGLAFEELVRNGRLARMSAEQVLKILGVSKTYSDFYKENPQFGPEYTKMGQEIAARLHRASQVFARDFRKMSPTRAQVRSFVELSGLTFGQYTWSRIRATRLPERDYGTELSMTPFEVAMDKPSQLISSGARAEKCSVSASL